MLRRTKIIATMGPAIANDKILTKILQAGVNLIRINMSHSTQEMHAKNIALIREVGDKLSKEVGILIDLQGPKIRIAKFKQHEVQLSKGASFILDPKLAVDAGDEQQVGIDYQTLADDLTIGDTLLLDDGFIVLEVKKIIQQQIHCIVKLGGKLSDNKGINLQGGGLSAATLTAKDKQDIIFAAQQQADYVAVSFVKLAADIEQTRELLQQADHSAGIVAKIERIEAMQNLESIIKAADALMVARGDLGIELGFAELPAAQKKIISLARSLNKAVITATQMMESMIYHPIPTRAEVTDIANAVFQGTDAVMLSAETATGSYPVATVEHMAQVCLAAERQRETQVSHHRLDCQFSRTDEAIAMAAMYTANHLAVKVIVALTESGLTPLWMSRIRSGIPIYGFSRVPKARGRMTLYRGVYPVDFDIMSYHSQDVIAEVINLLKNQNIVETNDKVIITLGDISGISGRANTMKIIVVE